MGWPPRLAKDDEFVEARLLLARHEGRCYELYQDVLNVLAGQGGEAEACRVVGTPSCAFSTMGEYLHGFHYFPTKSGGAFIDICCC